jgi:hypothetical protein
MRFADDKKGNVADAMAVAPIKRAQCILCGGPVFLRGGGLGMFSLLMENGFSSHYAHVRRGACEYSPEHDQRIMKALTRPSKEDAILC